MKGLRFRERTIEKRTEREREREILTVQVAPFRHGLEAHSSISMSHRIPVNPASQSHSKPGEGLASCMDTQSY